MKRAIPTVLALVLLAAMSFIGFQAADAAPAVAANVTEPSSPHADVVDSIADAPVDPWYPELRDLVEQLSDAYADKPHVGRFGETSGELPGSRALRLDTFTRDVLDAVRGRAGELAQFGPDAAWGFAATLVWIAHRETRIASNPAKLGNQDEGRAHGAWQVWSWKGLDPYAASTALDMLVNEPTSSWSLPKDQPWLGYPECARWLAAHPAP